MAMHHRERPYWGVQFHPESILTEIGEVACWWRILSFASSDREVAPQAT